MKWSCASCQLHRPLNCAYRSPGPARKRHYVDHHWWPALAASTDCRGHRQPPYLRTWAERRSPPQLHLLPSRQLALPHRLSPLCCTGCRLLLHHRAPPRGQATPAILRPRLRLLEFKLILTMNPFPRWFCHS
jgi:hypothetical protein